MCVLLFNVNSYHSVKILHALTFWRYKQEKKSSLKGKQNQEEKERGGRGAVKVPRGKWMKEPKPKGNQETKDRNGNGK